MCPLPSHILWQNEDQTITLIDVPQSIASAQGTDDHPCHDIFLSAKPLSTPFPTVEPKTPSARAKLAGNTVDEHLHVQYRNLLDQALSSIRARYEGKWCLSRQLPDPSDVDLPPNLLQTLSSTHQLISPVPCTECPSPTLSFYPVCTSNPCTLSLETISPSPSTSPSTLPSSLSSLNFHLPPSSTFSLSPLSSSSAFHTSLRNQSSTHELPRPFSLILLDPPWPNRSVSRKHKSPANPNNYSTPLSLPNLRRLILSADLDVLMGQDTLVAVWITNKGKVRKMVTGEGGLFEEWGVRVEEEWVWLKTTEEGEAVVGMESVWRKPYEVLIIGRRNWGMREEGEEDGGDGVKRRVLVGVPDGHSRKPCLKGLVEGLMKGKGEGRVLEIFARNLVAGWWSWGDECLKGNWEGSWRKRRNDES